MGDLLDLILNSLKSSRDKNPQEQDTRSAEQRRLDNERQERIYQKGLEESKRRRIENEQRQESERQAKIRAAQEAECQAKIRAALEVECRRREEEQRREHRRLAKAYKGSRNPSLALRLCKQCQFLNPGDAKTCNQCNTDLFNFNNYLARWKCFHCGSVNAGQNQTCHGCHGETRPPDYMWEILY